MIVFSVAKDALVFILELCEGKHFFFPLPPQVQSYDIK